MSEQENRILAMERSNRRAYRRSAHMQQTRLPHWREVAEIDRYAKDKSPGTTEAERQVEQGILAWRDMVEEKLPTFALSPELKMLRKVVSFDMDIATAVIKPWVEGVKPALVAVASGEDDDTVNEAVHNNLQGWCGWVITWLNQIALLPLFRVTLTLNPTSLIVTLRS